MTAHNSKQILIVDDDPDQLTIRELLLQARGFRTLAAEDAQSALALARIEQPDCALLDLHLPTEAAGIALLHALQALPQPPRIVILTGSNVQRLGCAADLGSAQALVEKGSPSTVLIEVLRRVCAEPA